MRKRIDNCIIPFTCIFSAAVVVVVLLLCWSNLTFVRNGDAITQHYPAFLYIGRWYREGLHALVTLQQAPNFWDFSFGYGADVTQTLAFYGMFDWSTIIFAVNSNENNGPILYTTMMLFRAYIAGTAFIMLCKEYRCGTAGSVIASFAYILCPFMLDGVFNGHHEFAIPLFYMPLIILCLERILKKERKAVLPYIVLVSLSILSSQYWFYMEIVFAIIYCIVRYVSLHSFDFKPLTFGKTAATISGYTLVGVLMTMPIIAPIIYGLIFNQRTSSNSTVPSLYSVEEYRTAIGNLVTSDSFNYYGYIGISACILLGVATLLIQKGEKWLFGAVTFK